MGVIISRRMRWVAHVARMGEERCIHGFGRETLVKKIAWKTKSSMGGLY